MSEAVICDRCKKAVAKQSAWHIDAKLSFVALYYDLCPICYRDFENIFIGKHNRSIDEVLVESEDGG